jgi:hypothetical protein
MYTSVGCQQKAVKEAYHILCDNCSNEKKVCAKCQESQPIIVRCVILIVCSENIWCSNLPPYTILCLASVKSDKQIREERQEHETRLASMSERHRRTLIRK